MNRTYMEILTLKKNHKKLKSSFQNQIQKYIIVHMLPDAYCHVTVLLIDLRMYNICLLETILALVTIRWLHYFIEVEHKHLVYRQLCEPLFSCTMQSTGRYCTAITL